MFISRVEARFNVGNIAGMAALSEEFITCRENLRAYPDFQARFYN